MKVLFAVHDEKVSSSIVKKYQKEYKEIISYKNVYYFNAILKELQRDKTYDTIVIDEELEEFTSSSYEQKDKFIFDKLDSITDEASKLNGNDMPIILICSERRAKSDEILAKLFSIGIYNAIIGNDRSTDEVCRLINKPRTKKEAKIYYKIDAVEYRPPEDEDDVSEEEMQHILSYFKKLGKNEDRYVECFKNIVSQYNDKQMRVIISILPLHVRSILEEKSPEYQKIVASGGGKIIPPRAVDAKKPQKGTSEKLLNDNSYVNKGKPIVIPSRLDKTLIKKVSIKKPSSIATTKIEEPEEVDVDIELEDLGEIAPAPKRRGRPRKVQEETDTEEIEAKPAPKRRGRPRKNPLPEEIEEQEIEEDEILPGIDDEDETEEETILPGFDDVETEEDEEPENEENVLPGIEDDVEEEYEEYDEEEEETDTQNTMLSGFKESDNQYNGYLEQSNDDYQDYDFTEYNSLLSGSKKVIAFVGTSKNGTSFIVNNIADILSSNGIDTAILDTTQNKNAYYIYTQNDENLRKTATNSIEYLIEGRTEGVQVNNNLTVYTELPNQENRIKAVGPILENLIKSYSAVLIDCDFNTPLEYFRNVQEIYLVQSMDVLTIQPLTAFLRELKAKDILDESKIKIIINKSVKIRGVTAKTIVGGMAYYNEPEMSYMTELFDRNSIIPIEIPFDIEVYKNYLEQIIECKISTGRYPKEFQTILKDLANIVYPLLPAKKPIEKRKKGYPYQATSNYSNNYANNGFSNNVNNILNNMKKRY